MFFISRADWKRPRRAMKERNQRNKRWIPFIHLFDHVFSSAAVQRLRICFLFSARLLFQRKRGEPCQPVNWKLILLLFPFFPLCHRRHRRRSNHFFSRGNLVFVCNSKVYNLFSGCKNNTEKSRSTFVSSVAAANENREGKKLYAAK